jgi:predicted RNase H-like HicB family nuclease
MAEKIREKFIILTAIYKREEGVWTAECKELGTATFGHTFEEAEADLEEAIFLHLNTLEEVGECERFLNENNIVIYQDKPPKNVPTELPVSPNTWVNRNIVPLPVC